VNFTVKMVRLWRKKTELDFGTVMAFSIVKMVPL
jgi:hypothetical protein